MEAGRLKGSMVMPNLRAAVIRVVALCGLMFSGVCSAEIYWLDSDVDATKPHYRTAEEACVIGEIQRRIDGYRAVDPAPYRYTPVNLGPENDGERICQSVIEKFEFGHWLTRAQVSFSVFRSGTPPACPLTGLADPDTGQCGVPKCNGDCPVAGGNGSNPIDSATGNKRQHEIDITGAGIFPLRFERWYNSHRVPDNNPRTLGVGWTHSYGAHLVPLYAAGVLVAIDAYRSNGAIQRFNISGGTATSDPDVTEALSFVTTASGVLASAVYTDSDDNRETYNDAGRLISITRRDGFIQTLSYATGTTTSPYVQKVTDPQGRTLTFQYTVDLLTSIVDAAGKTTNFAHANSDLTSVSYPNDTGGIDIRTYHYNEAGQTGGVSQPHVLTGITDESSQRYASWSYDTQRRGILSTHGTAASTIDRVSLLFNANGTSSITDAYGKTRTYGFDVKHRVAHLGTLSDPCDHCSNVAQSMTYDANGFPDGTTDFRGTVSNQDYDSRGLQTKVVEASNDAAGNKRTIETDWHATFRTPAERRTFDSTGVLFAKTVWTHNARGQVLTETRTDAASSTSRATATTYCEAADVSAGTCPFVGLMKSIDGPRTDVTDVTSVAYYASDDASCASAPATCPHRKGDLWKSTNALAQVTEYLAYDSAGRPTSIKAVNGVVTDIEYHPRGWLIARKQRGANASVETDDLISRVGYWPTGLVRKVTDPDGTFTDYTYDAAHRLTDITDSMGGNVHYSLNNAGDRTGETTKDAAQVVVRSLTRLYDNQLLGRLQSVTDAYSHTTSYTYDGNGNTDTVTDALNRLAADNDYDPLNRLAHTLQDVTGIAANTSFRYDALDQLRKITDPKGLETNYTHNGLGDLKTLASPDTGTTTYTYDSGGNRQTQIDARGVTTTYAYDALNRLTSIAYSDGTPGLTYHYDTDSSKTVCQLVSLFDSNPVGQLEKITDGSGSTQYCFDRFGRVAAKKQITNGVSFGSVIYGLTPSGSLSSLKYPSGLRVDYIRNANGRISGLTWGSGSSTQVLLASASYYPFGPAGTLEYGDRRILKRTLNLNYQPGIVEDLGPGGLSLGYEFDAVGNLFKLRTSSQSDPPLRRYAHDVLGRLTEAHDGGTDALLQGYGYDDTGNRLSATVAGVTTNYGYPVGNHRLTSVGATARTYDNAGNTLSIGGTARGFVFDGGNRMTQFTQGGSTVVTYAYNGKGEQVRRTPASGTDTRYYVYDEAGHLLGIYDANRARVQEFIWMDDLPVGVVSGGQVLYIEPDHLGTPRAVIDPTREVAVWTWPLTGEAFGNSAPNEDPDGDATAFVMDLRFPGQRYDAVSGLNYNYFRDYEAVTGRYAESDPIGIRGGVSTYAYAIDAPLTSKDPLGLLIVNNSCIDQKLEQKVRDAERKIEKKLAQCSSGCSNGGKSCVKCEDVEKLKRALAHSSVGCAQSGAYCAVGETPGWSLTIRPAGWNPKLCGCLEATIFHELLHNIGYVHLQGSFDTVDKVATKCFPCGK
jgi:RHS repeat-associated protein